MKNNIPPNRLFAYSALAISILAAKKTTAQIIYTDVDPDAAIINDDSGGQLTEYIDMNHDGVVDVRINNNFCTSCSYYVVDADFQPNQVATYGSFYHLARALEMGATIGGDDFIWKKTSAYIQFGNLGAWDGEGDHYLAVRLKEGTDFHYGWIRLEVSDNNSMFYVRDFAYNSVLNEPIAAGQTTPCGDDFENNDSFHKARLISTGLAYHALITPAGDKDYYKAYVEDANIRVTLTGLPKNYNLRLFNVNHQLIGSSLHTGINNDTIVYNNGTGGYYYIQVFGKNNTYDSGNCYTLKLESGTAPFRLPEAETASAEQEPMMVYPNPASNTITIANLIVPVLSVRLLDVSARVIREWNPSGETQQLVFNISDVEAGYYFLQVVNADGCRLGKVTVVR